MFHVKRKYSDVKQHKFMLEFGGLCAFFRKNILHITLRELSNKSGVPIPTLSSFELGRSSNLRFLYIYLVSCETESQKNILINGIDQILERGYNYD